VQASCGLNPDTSTIINVINCQVCPLPDVVCIIFHIFFDEPHFMKPALELPLGNSGGLRFSHQITLNLARFRS
jgi:hypothetical protein